MAKLANNMEQIPQGYLLLTRGEGVCTLLGWCSPMELSAMMTRSVSALLNTVGIKYTLILSS